MLLRAIPAMLIASTLALGACAAAPGDAGTGDVVATIIVKPLNPSPPEAVVRMAREALGSSAGVRYARPLAGDAHLLYLTPPATREEVAQLVQRMQASNAFQYVERDSIMKIK